MAAEQKSLRVLEIGGHGAGYCGRLFQRGGADVLRLERSEQPRWVSERATDLYLHSGKRRVSGLELASIRALADRADVVILEAESAGAVEAMGFDDISAPVRVSITPFGRSGPRRNWQATPATLLAMGGQTIMSGDADRAPLTIPGHYLEYQAGVLAHVAAHAAHFEGVGRQTDISMLEVSMSLTQFSFMRRQCMGEERTRHGNDHHYLVPMSAYACADGWIYVAVVPAFWDAFTIFLDQPELLVDERFASNDLRTRHRTELQDIVAAAIVGRSRAEWVARAEEARVPVGAVLSFEEVLEDPHLAHRRVWDTLIDDDGTRVLAPKVPFSPRNRTVAAEKEANAW